MALRLKYFTAFALFGMAPWWSITNAMRLVSRGGNRAIKFSDRKARYLSQTPDRYTSTALGAKKKANEEENPTAPVGWTTIKYGTEQDEKNAEMEDRLRAAERWVSKKLTDKESQELNRVMGIEAEVLAALAEEEDEKRGIKKSGKKIPQDKSAAKTKLKEFLSAETRDAAKVKGFLELNPYICSGCGTPFQSKSTDTPGFLPKDKIKLHLAKAQKIRDKQEAIKILELAGIEVNLFTTFCRKNVLSTLKKVLRRSCVCKPSQTFDSDYVYFFPLFLKNILTVLIHLTFSLSDG